MAADGAARADRLVEPPVSRKLQIYAFDPSMSLALVTAQVNSSTVHIRWEGVSEGPVGEYIEVVDVDPASACAYPPVNLNDPYLLAQDGLSPSEGNPQFHQQMVYAVAMMTIASFEQALGRRVHWSPRRIDESGRWLGPEDSYVQRLRIYPHALREANAYYSPDKKSLLFGYFNAMNTDPREELPGGMVFSCLSHDIICHEITHAILDGIHRRLLDPSNPDVLAFHEAFADLVAIFQHFTLPGVLEHQIRQTRGDLSTKNLLSQLAAQFGRATRHGGALRDALGSVNPATGLWERKRADPAAFSTTVEPHARGAILVAALFDAFLAMYDSHTADLLRIASGGTGLVANGELPPDLIRRLADEARKVSSRLIQICIRALDYLPPVDVTFGDFLRAMITIDSDLVPRDDRHYRVALIRAFRDRGIFPRDVRTVSVETLRWNRPTDREKELFGRLLPPPNVLRTIAYANDYAPVDGIQPLSERSGSGAGQVIKTGELSRGVVERYQQIGAEWKAPDEASEAKDTRKSEHLNERQFASYLHDYLYSKARELEEFRQELGGLLGVDLLNEEFKFEVLAVRPTIRIHPDGRTKTELLILITQRERRTVSMASVSSASAERTDDEPQLSYRFQGGCTLLIDPVSGVVSYCIVKRISGGRRREHQEAFLRQRLSVEGLDARARYHVWKKSGGIAEPHVPQEPFRILHGGSSQEDWL